MTVHEIQDRAGTASRKEVTIYTDGGAVPNPGAGGYGVVLRFGQHRKELSGGFCLTTNNRMELMAAIVGLESLKEPCQVTLHSDSQYIVNAQAQPDVLLRLVFVLPELQVDVHGGTGQTGRG